MEEASVAGESPDRSKKRESSAEPTPGSASPVPEARGERDPRLAVAREDATPSASAAQRGGVDTATKIFSIRELRSEETEGAETPSDSEDPDTQNPSAKGGPGGPEGDARLRAAVAAWVTSGSTGERPTGDEDPEDAVEKPTGSEAADGAEGSGDVATAEGPEDAETPAGGPETGDAEDAGEVSVADASEGAESAQEADTGERAEGAGAGVTGDAESPENPEDAEPAKGESDGDDDVTEGERVADAAAEGESEADKTPVAAPAGKVGADADAHPETTDTASGETADAGSTEAEVDEAEADTAPEPAEGDTPLPATGAKPDDRPGSAEGDAPSDATGPKADDRPKPAEGKASTGTAGPKDDDRPEPAEGKASTDATGPKADDRPKPAEGKASTGTAGPKDDDRPEPAEGKASTGTTAPKTDSHPESAEGEGEPAPGAVAAEGDTDTDPRTTGTDPEDAAPSASPTDAQPKAADDEKAPAGPPAPDNETRTGGAGGNTKTAEGEAEAVDHPTTVFKAPRPPKPAVDQPTTMLKAPKAPTAPTPPKTPETPAERTSRFVALKPLDEPRRESPRRDTPPKDATRPVTQLGPEHTTQQPLPPKPPLDLLAELTNTPPPPETPVRTAIRRVKIWTPLVILLAIVFAVVQAVRPLPTPSLTLTADDSYTFDGTKTNLPWPSEGQGWMDVNGIGTMGDFGKQTPVAIGSVAKAMTAYIVLKDHPLKAGTEGEKITVDATAEKEGGYDKDGESTLNTVKAGDILTEKQALSAIMIPSANNIARLLARWDAGSEAAFIKKMNDTAKSLGMTNTTYTDASGLKETTVSSAEDQVKLGNQLVKIQALMDITKLPSWVDPSGHKWTNYNRLVPYNNSLGIKTGTTTAAGGNLLFAATKEVGGETAVVVGAILGQHTAPIIDTVNAVSKTAMLAAQDAMTSAKILKKGTVVGYVDDQLGGHTPVVVTKDVAAVGWAGLKVKLSFAPDAVPHTAKAGTKVGTLTVGDGSSGAVKVPVALQKDLAEPALTSKLTRLG
ncbi:D-alanyl-D-alanine carboxypeptidase [Streptomyces sp. NBC_01288]|uniref:D-alanyl-D-alanine carboxypeptidase n=1 Tax=Streptomyces sp. NBC_01288 TaxID=2903814 RepID=UPI002E130BDF|nr:D-alanyl-D-alanine carboxypeptidase [Streptomyces sp. NBC_01288]